MSPAETIRITKLARAIEAAMEANPDASFAEAVEALAMIAAQKAFLENIGTVAEQSWTNATTHLFDLAQAGRLYRDPQTGAEVTAA